MGLMKEKMIEDDARGVGFVKELIDGGYLEGAALGVAKKWVDVGDEGLTEKQAYVLKNYVFGPFVTKYCRAGGHEITMVRDAGGSRERWTLQLVLPHAGEVKGRVS